MGAMKMPKAKAPKAPKAPKVDPKKAGKKVGKKAAGKLKRKINVKKILLIVIPLLLLAIGALLVWLFMFNGPVPSAVVQKAINAAFIGDDDKFKEFFTDESREALESAWSGADFGAGSHRGSWHRMMAGLLTADEMKSKIVEEAVGEGAERGRRLDELLQGAVASARDARSHAEQPPLLEQ